MAAHPQHHHWTLEQYVAHEQNTGVRYEYIDGQIYAMTGGTIRHGIISGNIFGTLFNMLRGGACRAYNADIGIAAQSKNRYFYPDISVVCGEIKIDPALPERIANPTILFEVLSDGTEAYDRTTKFNYYKQISSLQSYVIVEQEQPHITHHSRSGDTWTSTVFTQLEDQVLFSALGLTLPLKEVYQDITWEGLL